jgi:PAS domain S-box-containing protein
VRTSPDPNRQQAEALDRLTRLQALTAALSEAVTSEQVADAILAQAVAVLGASAGVVSRLSEDGRELVTVHATGYPAEVVSAWSRFPADARLPLCDAVRKRQAVLLANRAERDARYPEVTRLSGVLAEGAVAALPLLVRGGAIGGIGLRFPTKRDFTEQDRAFLLTAAGLCAQALERARLYDTERAARERAERESAERRRADEALRESEARFRSVVECNMIGIGFWHADGRLTDPNDALLRMTGYTREEFASGRVRWQDLTPPEYAPLDERALAQIRATGWCEPFEKEYIRKDGSRIPVLLGGGCFAGCRDRGPFFALDISALKRAERDARRSEQFYRLLTEAVPGLAWSANTVDGLDYLSRQWEEYTGLTLGQVRERSWQAANHPDEVEGISARFTEAAQTGRPFEMEFRYRRRDGEYRWFLGRQVPIPDPDGRGLRWVGAIIDIDDRKRAEDALRESEGRLRNLSNNLPHGAIYQVVADARGGRRFLYVSAGVERLFGVTPAEAIADAASVYGLIHEDDRPRLAAAEEAALRDRTPFDWEFRSRTRSGEVIWVHARSAPRPLPTGEVVWEGIVMDVTSRKRAEEALDREQELLATMFEKIPVMLTVYEPDSKVLRLNPAFERSTGWSAPDAAGVSLMDECYPDPAYRQRVWDFMQSCRDGWMDIRMRTRHGRDLETSWANVRLSSGVQVGIGLDITDRKRYEEALKDADRRKDEFLATLAHELRNPLAPLRNGLQVMKLAGGDAAAVEQARTMMERQLAQMVRLIDDLLDVSRISRGKLQLRREQVELARVVHSAVEGSRPLIEASGHDLAIALPPEPVVLEADPTRLAQVLANLLTNAAKYTDRGGRIALTAERQGREVVVTVRDTGIGIAPEHLPRLFEMFSQVAPALERSQGGLGIGLSLVKGLVEMHGGRVEAHSEGPGKGSAFTVCLPLPREVTAFEAPRPGGGPQATARPGRRVLVADDNRDAADSLAILLRLQGHEVYAAHDGREAVEAAGWFRPELAFLDIGMPRLNGLEAARSIRGQPWGREMVLVAVTGWGQEEDRRRAAEAGFDRHLTKPVDPAALQELLARLPAGENSGHRG